MGLLRRWSAILGTIGAVAVAAGFRIPAFISTRQINYDDGVYASSVLLMRQGLDPFADFFSSQGPLFLPVLRLADMTGIGDLRAARLAMVGTGALLALGSYLVASRNHGRTRAVAASLVCASSGLLLVAAGPLQSDGLALAFGLLALAAASGDLRARPWLAPLAGVLLGAGLAVKSLYLLPTALVVLSLILMRAARSGLAAFLISGSVAGVLLSIPWGLEAVWDQYVLFHLMKDQALDVGTEIGAVWSLLWHHELPLLVLLATGIALTLTGERRRLLPGPHGTTIPAWLLWAWALSSVVMVIFITGAQPGFTRFAGFLVPPLILLAIRSPLPTNLAIGFVLLAIPYQWVTLDLPEPVPPDEGQEAVIELLRDLPRQSWVVADEPGLAWAAGRLSHPDTVDSSFGRLSTGSLSPDVIEAAAGDANTCAFLAWSGRFASVELAEAPVGYGIAYEDEGRLLAVRPDCQRP